METPTWDQCYEGERITGPTAAMTSSACSGKDLPEEGMTDGGTER